MRTDAGTRGRRHATGPTDCVNHCVNKVSPKWASRLAAYDVWIYEQCEALEQSIRIDGPSLR